MRTWAQPRPVRLAAVAVLAVSAMLVPSPVAASLPPETPADASTAFKVADPVALDALIKSSPTDFGGMFLDPATDTLVVQLVGGPRAAAARQAVAALPRASAELSGLTASTTMRFRTVAHSKAELEEIKERVTTDRAWSRVAGPLLSEWYVDVFNNRVAVSVTTLTDAVRRAATAAFGAAVELSVKPLALPTSKQSDSAPWTGGAQIAVHNSTGVVRDCSSSFALVAPNGDRAGLTAGHCTDAVGNAVTHNGASMGTVVTREYDRYSRDFAIYSGSTYQNRVYDSISTTMPVTSVTSFVLLGSYGFCFGGYSMGDRNCEGRITGLETCAAFLVDYNPRHSVCGLVLANHTQAGYLAREGDSGGPVYQLRSPIGGGPLSISAVGLIVGRPVQDHTSAYFHMLATVLPAGWSVARS